MSTILESVDQRTNLAGQNRLELLLFRLASGQYFGINVFKVCEVMATPKLARLPHTHPAICGVARIRGKTIPVLDLAQATGGAPLAPDVASLIIVTEYNRSVQAFKVAAVDRIVNLNWQEILPPPSGASGSAYLTGVTDVDDRLVQILDVEKVLAEVNVMDQAVQMETGQDVRDRAANYSILVVDDSIVARRQVHGTLEQLGFEVHLAKNGEEALEVLMAWRDSENASALDSLLMVISDIEMPRMDGYTLTARLREAEQLKSLYILLHTSLSGVFNEGMSERVGADGFLAKFAPDELAARVLERLDSVCA